MTTLLFFFALTAGAVVIDGTPQEARVPGIVDFGGEGTKGVLSAPETVRVGEAFKMTITTFGSGCEREGDTNVVMTATGAVVMVYDFTAATHPGVICTAVIKRMPHTVTLRFEKPGEALIQIWGRRAGPQTPPFGLPAVLEHRVTIR
jgi:predicted RNA-binding protein with TRAM domain